MQATINIVRRWMILFVTCSLWFCCSAITLAAQIPQLTAPVMDQAHLLSESDHITLNQELLTFARKKGSQIVFLIIPTLGEEDIFDYSSRVFDQWKLGRKGISDGVLVVIAVQDRKIRINPGSGIEGAIPDITAKAIIDQIMQPEFRQGNYFAGIYGAANALEKLINHEELPALKKPATQEGYLVYFFFIFIFLMPFFYWLERILGKIIASGLSGVLNFGLAYVLGYPFFICFTALFIGFVLAYFLLLNRSGFHSDFWNGPDSGFNGRGGGFFGDGGFRGGGFSGGGGGFSGGGASGGW